MYPYFNYCTPVWGNTLDVYLKPIIVLQNKAVRLISGAKRRTLIWNDREILIPAHTDPLYKKLNVLKLCQIYIYSVQQFVFKYYHGMLPNVFDDFYSTNSSFHSHNTRSRNMLRPPKNSSIIKIRTMGVRTYNYFYNRLIMDCSLLSYKVALKKVSYCQRFDFSLTYIA